MAQEREQENDAHVTFEQAQEVKQRYEMTLLAKANVVGVGVGFRQRGGESTGHIAIIVLVTHKVPRAQLEPEDLLPSEIEGVPVDVHVVGEIEPHS